MNCPYLVKYYACDSALVTADAVHLVYTWYMSSVKTQWNICYMEFLIVVIHCKNCCINFIQTSSAKEHAKKGKKEKDAVTSEHPVEVNIIIQLYTCLYVLYLL